MGQHRPLCILGSGAAGYTAAIYAARANLPPLLFSGSLPGGQLTITTDVENYPGFADVIQGPWLMEQMQKQARHVGTTIVAETIVQVDLRASPKTLVGDSGETYTADAIIIATGAQAKWLGIPGEEAFMGQGVSACATCDGSFFKDVPVAVIGGGNTAVEEALYLTNHASHITLIHRRDQLRAEKILQDRLLAHPKISVLWNHGTEEILGSQVGVTGLKLRDLKTNKEKILEVEGVFVAIGHKPATDMFQGQLPKDDYGYLLHHPNSSKTDVMGVFVAGDVCDPVYRQAITAAGMGCMAALDAVHYCQSLPQKKP
jgi:thioredoxin reductase (NADPH)